MYRRGTLNRVADALSRQLVMTVSRMGAPTCPWYRRMVETVNLSPPDNYRIEGGRLYRHLLHNLDFRETDPAEQWKTCVPRDECPALLQRYHDASTAGHLGIAKTIARIAQQYYWPGMFRDIATYVWKCPNCLAHKTAQSNPWEPSTRPRQNIHDSKCAST